TFAFEWIESGCKWKLPRNIFLQAPFKNVTPSFVLWKRYFWNLSMRKRLGMRGNLYFTIAHLERVDRIFVSIDLVVPTADDFPIVRIEVHFDSAEFFQQKVQERFLFAISRCRGHDRILIESVRTDQRMFLFFRNTGNSANGFEDAVQLLRNLLLTHYGVVVFAIVPRNF